MSQRILSATIMCAQHNRANRQLFPTLQSVASVMSVSSFNLVWRYIKTEILYIVAHSAYKNDFPLKLV
jgi:hypothetical protein